MSLLAFTLLTAPAQAQDVLHAADANGDPVIGFGDTVLRPGETPAGTVFALNGVRSKPWGGRIALATPPSLQGALRVGETVRAVAGTWSGGWGDELDELRIEACQDETATRCETLAAPAWEYETPRDGTAVIAAKYAGWYLRAADRRRDRFEVSVTMIYDRASDVPTLTAAPRVALTPLAGPVTTVSAPHVKPEEPAVTPPTVTVQPTTAKPPRVALYRTARRAKRTITVGRVACAAPCTVKFTVSDGCRTYRRTRTGSGPLTLTAKPRKGTLRIEVTIDGGATTVGRVKLR